MAGSQLEESQAAKSHSNVVGNVVAGLLGPCWVVLSEASSSLGLDLLELVDLNIDRNHKLVSTGWYQNGIFETIEAAAGACRCNLPRVQRGRGATFSPCRGSW